MHGFKIAALAATSLIAAAAFTGSARATHVPTDGSPITLGNCVTSPCASTFPANEPFFIRHGFVSDTTRDESAWLLSPRSRFELTVDGQRAPSLVDLDWTSEQPAKFYVSNFRHGMTGVHTFVGCWYAEGTLQYCGTRTVTFTV